ncbi:MAG: hypothetical protein WC314_01665 [Vulcanimicrobiota bacterium]
MHSVREKRKPQRGNSFGSCLLAIVVFFGGLGFYYFNYFQWRHFEKPLDGVTYADVDDSSQLNSFRKQALSSVCDPILQQADRIKKIRDKTKVKGEKTRKVYPEMEQDLIEVRNRLKELMTEARLRRIPKKFKTNYDPTLLGLKDLFESVNEFEASFDQETQGARDKMVAGAIKKWNAGKKKVSQTRDYFHGDGWAD